MHVVQTWNTVARWFSTTVERFNCCFDRIHHFPFLVFSHLQIRNTCWSRIVYCFKLFNPFLLPRSCSYASIVFHSTSEHLSQFYHGYENRESFVPDLGSLRLIVDDLNTNNDIILLLRYCETIHRLYHVVLLSFASHLVSKCDYSQFVSKSGFVLCIHSHSYYTVSLTWPTTVRILLVYSLDSGL